jgi:hypothetical protein
MKAAKSLQSEYFFTGLQAQTASKQTCIQHNVISSFFGANSPLSTFNLSSLN